MARRLELQFQFAPHLDRRFTHNSTCQGHKSLCAIRPRRRGWGGGGETGGGHSGSQRNLGWGEGPRRWGADGGRFGCILGPFPSKPASCKLSRPQLQTTCSIFSPNLAPPSPFSAQVSPPPPEVSTVNTVLVVVLSQTGPCPAQPYRLHYA